MGSGSSHGGIALQLETSSSFTGQEVTGIIHMSLKSYFEYPSLALRFKGKEKTSWTETRTESRTDSSGNTHTETITDYYSGKHSLVDISYPLYSWPDGLSVGQYSIPFSFVLPSNTSGSFHYSEGSTKADIIYKFQAILCNSRQKIKGKIPIFIKQAVHFYSSNINLDKSANMKTWCCYNQGTCKLKLNYPQDTYNPSQVARFYVEVDNSESKLRVNGISCRLFYELRLKDNYRGSKYVNREVIREESRRQIETGSRLLSNEGVEFNLNLGEKMNKLDMMYSTKSTLIECLYSNEVSAIMDGYCMCCGDRPSIKSTINIVPNVIEEPSAPIAPPDWSPRLLEKVSISSYN